MIDSVLYGLVILAVLLFSDTNFDALTTGEETIPNGVLLVGLLIFGVYQVAFTALRGQTIGKIVVHTKVIDAESGALPGWQSAFIRWGAPASLATIPWLGYVSLVMYAWLLRDKRRQGLHDKVARTLVIRVV